MSIFRDKLHCGLATWGQQGLTCLPWHVYWLQQVIRQLRIGMMRIETTMITFATSHGSYWYKGHGVAAMVLGVVYRSHRLLPLVLTLRPLALVGVLLGLWPADPEPERLGAGGA